MDYLSSVDAARDDIIRAVQGILRIPSVESEAKQGMPFGEGINDALGYVLELARGMGFDTFNADGFAGHADFGHGDELIGILVHLDVVPEGDGWTYPPFGGEIHDGRIYGRGAIDDKGPAIACLYAMKALKDSGFKPRADARIRLIFGLNEEGGQWRCLEHYFTKCPKPRVAFSPDACFPGIYAEKGILCVRLVSDIPGAHQSALQINGGTRSNMVPDACNATIHGDLPRLFHAAQAYIATHGGITCKVENDALLLHSQGVSAHASRPELGVNAISRLMLLLDALDLPGIEGETVRAYAQKIGLQTDGESLGCKLADDVSGPLTLNAGVIQTNGVCHEIELNIRYPVTYTAGQVLERIEAAVKGTPLNAVFAGDNPPHFIEADGELPACLLRAYAEETQDYDTGLIAVGGGTYARAIPNAMAFGPAFPGDSDIAHQKDEYIDIGSLMKMTRIYARALKMLSE